MGFEFILIIHESKQKIHIYAIVLNDMNFDEKMMKIVYLFQNNKELKKTPN